jgi:hypothetical protein
MPQPFQVFLSNLGRVVGQKWFLQFMFKILPCIHFELSII